LQHFNIGKAGYSLPLGTTGRLRQLDVTDQLNSDSQEPY